MSDTAQEQVPTARQLKVNLTLWRKAVAEHGGQSPQAYNAYQRFLRLQDVARETASR